MFVIMLQGPRSCGKTTVLNLVYKSLKSTGGTVIKEKTLGTNPKDFEAVLDYPRDGAVKKIAIFTMGDYSCAVVKVMEKYADCVDILVIACNDRFKRPFKAIKRYQHKIFTKKRHTDDTAMADAIFAYLVDTI